MLHVGVYVVRFSVELNHLDTHFLLVFSSLVFVQDSRLRFIRLLSVGGLRFHKPCPLSHRNPTLDPLLTPAEVWGQWREIVFGKIHGLCSLKTFVCVAIYNKLWKTPTPHSVQCFYCGIELHAFFIYFFFFLPTIEINYPINKDIQSGQSILTVN